jgi:hypothetical protein
MPTRTTCSALLALLLAACGLPDRQASTQHPLEIDVCTPVGCDDSKIAPLYDAGPFQPDPRPVAILQLWGGSYPCGDTGNVAWYTDQAFPNNSLCEPTNTRALFEDDGCIRVGCSTNAAQYNSNWDGDGELDVWNKMETELEEIYDAGFRRIILNRPAGRYQFDSPTGKDFPPSSQFWTLEEEHPDVWPIVQHNGPLTTWVVQKGDVSVGIYAGYRIHDPCDLNGWSAGHRVPNPWNKEDMCVAAQNILGWAGVPPDLYVWVPRPAREFWMDNASKAEPDADGGPIPARDSLVAFSRGRSWSNFLKFVGESIPFTISPTHYELDERYITKLAWMQRQATFELRARDGDAAPPDNETSFHVPDVTGIEPRELHALFQPCPQQPCPAVETVVDEVVKRYAERGYIPAAWHSSGASTLTVVAEACRDLANIPTGPLTSCAPD